MEIAFIFLLLICCVLTLNLIGWLIFVGLKSKDDVTSWLICAVLLAACWYMSAGIAERIDMPYGIEKGEER